MKRFYVVGAALMAVSSVFAVMVASASASNPEWLIDSAPVLELTAVETVGALKLIDTKAPVVGKAAVECEGVLDGTVGPEGEDEITEVLTPGGTAIPSVTLTKALVEGTGLKCKAVEGCEKTTEPEVWLDNLPWHTQLELLSSNVVDHIVGNGEDEPGWHITKCLIFGLNTSDLCEGLTYALIENMTEGGVSDLLANFVEPPSLKALCEASGTESGVASSTNGLIRTLSGLEITVSGEGIEGCEL